MSCPGLIRIISTPSPMYFGGKCVRYVITNSQQQRITCYTFLTWHLTSYRRCILAQFTDLCSWSRQLDRGKECIFFCKRCCHRKSDVPTGLVRLKLAVLILARSRWWCKFSSWRQVYNFPKSDFRDTTLLRRMIEPVDGELLTHHPPTRNSLFTHCNHELSQGTMKQIVVANSGYVCWTNLFSLVNDRNVTTKSLERFYILKHICNQAWYMIC